MTDPADDADTDPPEETGSSPPLDHDIEDTPTVSCSRCDRTWDLAYELDDLQVGNRALERFALDHRRHTGHFPDDVTPWLVDCRHCRDEECFLSEQPARRWARTHVRHTRHTVTIQSPLGDSSELLGETE